MPFILGWTPLHEAANHGHYHMAQLLLKHGANVNAAGLDDITPLHDAASFGNQKLVKMFIDKGADPFFKVRAQNESLKSLILFSLISRTKRARQPRILRIRR